MSASAHNHPAWADLASLIPIDPSQNALYNLPTNSQLQKTLNDAPWRKNPQFFTTCLISPLALLKMTIHARSGSPLEVMGLMTGYVSGTSIIVTDAFRLPVEGTETRVNAQAEADEYQVNFGIASRDGGGQQENPIGWYHSHPGYGCWLSGIDVGTQMQQQKVLDPFVAVVVDPDRTVGSGKVEIGAFRTFPEGYKPQSKGGLGDDGDEYQTIPMGKIEDFGAHASSYYALEVKHFKSTLDTHLLGLLWNKYWVSTLSQSPLSTNREYGDKQIADQAVKTTEAALNTKGASGRTGEGIMTGASRGRTEVASTASGGVRIVKDAKLEQIVKGGKKIASEEVAGLLAAEVKMKLFHGVVGEARQKMQSDAGVVSGESEVAEANG